MKHSTPTRNRKHAMSLVALTLAGLSLSACGGSSPHQATPSVSIKTLSHSSIAPDTTPTTPPSSADPSTTNSTTKKPSSTSAKTDSTKSRTESGSTQVRSQNQGNTASTSTAKTKSPSHTARTHGSTQGSASHPSATSNNVAADKAAVSTSMSRQGSTHIAGSGPAVRIDASSIGLHHSITSIGLKGGVLSPAAYQIGLYRGYDRVNPGDPGIAVLAGHVTWNGPDVFYKLNRLQPGATFTITYANGGAKTFRITDKASINKNMLQKDARIWGSTSKRVIALISCDSNSGWVNAQHHTNNLAVWAEAV